MSEMDRSWDVIGDVHGKNVALQDLLGRLGYRPTGGVWRNPMRRALFVGDLVDRGDDVAGVLATVKAMADAGEALVLLGNHEFNLLSWYTPDGKGGYLSERTERKAHQTAKSMAYFDADPDARDLYLAWFRRLPITLTIKGARFVHAYWGADQIETLAGRNTLDACGWGDSAFRRTPVGRATELLIKGPEIRLPKGLEIVDRQGACRKDARIKWWVDGRGRGYREMVLPDNPALDGLPLPAGAPYEDGAGGPIFFGHYGFAGFPGLLAPKAACVDYTGSNNSGVGAYRWNGEQVLREENFVQ